MVHLLNRPNQRKSHNVHARGHGWPERPIQCVNGCQAGCKDDIEYVSYSLDGGTNEYDEVSFQDRCASRCEAVERFKLCGVYPWCRSDGFISSMLQRRSPHARTARRSAIKHCDAGAVLSCVSGTSSA